MEAGFLGVPDVPLWLFVLLSLTTIATTMLGMLTGTVGGLGLLAVMAIFFPPAILVPVHTFVQLGVGSSRAIIMWRYVIKQTLIPFMIGAAFGAAVLFLAGNRARVYYQSVKSKEELEADLRENRRAMQAALEGKSFADGDDPVEGMEPHEIEALLRQNAPDGDPYAGMAPDEINAYLAKQQEEQVGKHLSMPRNIPRPR